MFLLALVTCVAACAQEFALPDNDVLKKIEPFSWTKTDVLKKQIMNSSFDYKLPKCFDINGEDKVVAESNLRKLDQAILDILLSRTYSLDGEKHPDRSFEKYMELARKYEKVSLDELMEEISQEQTYYSTLSLFLDHKINEEDNKRKFFLNVLHKHFDAAKVYLLTSLGCVTIKLTDYGYQFPSLKYLSLSALAGIISAGCSCKRLYECEKRQFCLINTTVQLAHKASEAFFLKKFLVNEKTKNTQNANY